MESVEPPAGDTDVNARCSAPERRAASAKLYFDPIFASKSQGNHRRDIKISLISWPASGPRRAWSPRACSDAALISCHIGNRASNRSSDATSEPSHTSSDRPLGLPLREIRPKCLRPMDAISQAHSAICSLQSGPPPSTRAACCSRPSGVVPWAISWSRVASAALLDVQLKGRSASCRLA